MGFYSGPEGGGPSTSVLGCWACSVDRGFFRQGGDMGPWIGFWWAVKGFDVCASLYLNFLSKPRSMSFIQGQCTWYILFVGC